MENPSQIVSGNEDIPAIVPQENHQIEEGKVTIIREKKSAFCKYYRRGCCTFTAEDCKFAHGISDYNLVEIKPENYRSKTFPLKNKKPTTVGTAPKNTKHKEEDEEDHEEDVEEKKDSDSKNTVFPNINYNNFYEYQFVLQEKGEVTEIHSQEVINEDQDVRRALRRKLNLDLQTGLVDALFEKFKTKALKKSVIEQYFLHANWMVRWKFLLNQNYIYEIKTLGNEIYIAKQLSPEAFDEYMKDCIIKIVNEKQLLDRLPISPMVVTKCYYQFLTSVDPYTPSHHTYLRLRDFKSMDEYLNHLQDNMDFMKKLIQVTGRNDLQEDSKIFGNSSQEIKGLKEQMKGAILELMQSSSSSSSGLLSLHDCETAIAKKSLPAAKNFGNNHPQLKRALHSILLDQDIVSMNLNSDIYVFSPLRFHQADPIPLKDNLQKQIYSMCSTLAPLNSVKPLSNNLTKNFSHTSSAMEENHLDLNKVVLVDNQKNLDLAIDYFTNTDNIQEIGIDLEGLLKDDVNIELVQCSSKDKIFIFDIYTAHLSALNSEESKSFYFNLTKFLKDLLEDPTKCKIFHDCRQDSAALHSYFNICPSNIFDLSAVYMLIEFIKKHQTLHLTKQEQDAPATDDNKSTVKTNHHDDIKLPGLNEILEKYQATHGINKLKSVMKNRFRNFPREYFLKRPIDPEFFIYSAKDVEDLVEMKEKMQSTLKLLLNNYDDLAVIDDEKIDFLCKKVSKIYAQNGCSHFLNQNA